jgi:8-amino-7-oxononanoate synthase
MSSNANAAFRRDLEDGLRDLETRSQRRNLSEVCGINLCSNDYLGLSQHPDLRSAIVEGVLQAEHVGGTGSRLLSGHAHVWSELEEEFSRFVGTESALYFGSGYAANVGLLSCLLQKDDVVFSDAHNHASLIDGIRLSGARKIVYPHLDLDALEIALRARSGTEGRKLVVTETVFSMDGDVAPVGDLLGLCERYGAVLIADEAHATGVQGPGGRGILAQSEFAQRVLAMTHTCGKALASAGAFVCGSAILKEHLINHARTFLFSTAMPPYMAAQIRGALKLAQGMDEQREQLLRRSREFVAGLREMAYHTAGSCTQIVPVLLGSNDDAVRAAEFLGEQGFAVRAIRPPTVPEGSARLRFSINTAIASQDLQRLEGAMGMWAAHHQERVMAGRA